MSGLLTTNFKIGSHEYVYFTVRTTGVFGAISVVGAPLPALVQLKEADEASAVGPDVCDVPAESFQVIVKVSFVVVQPGSAFSTAVAAVSQGSVTSPGPRRQLHTCRGRIPQLLQVVKGQRE